MTAKRFLVALVTLTVCALLGASASAEAPYPSVLGTDSTVYMLHPGRMGELFPNQSATPEHRVLALDVIGTDGALDRLLVPGTDGAEVESNTALVFDSASETVYILWESSYEAFSPLSSINLTGFGPEGWIEPIAVSGSPSVEKSSPHLAVTRDFVTVDGENGETNRLRRTLLHLVWFESGPDGVKQAVYSSILLLDGSFFGSNGAVKLTDVDADHEATVEGALLTDGVLTIRQGEDPQSVVVLFGSEGDGHLRSLRLRVLPGELSLLADSVHDFILASQGEAHAPVTAASLQHLARSVDTYLQEIGNHVSAAFLAHATAELTSFLKSSAPGVSLATLAESVRDLLIGLGETADEAGVQRITGPSRHQWIDVGVRGAGPPTREIRSYQVTSQVVATRPVPEIMVEHPVSVLNSPNGDNILVYWQNEDAVSYRETTVVGTWSDIKKIILGGEVGLDVAVRLLEERVDTR